MKKKNVSCRYCGDQNSVRRKGVSPAGHQRYKCEACGRCFQVSYLMKAYEPGVHEKVIDMSTKGRSIRQIARMLKIDRNTVMDK